MVLAKSAKGIYFFLFISSRLIAMESQPLISVSLSRPDIYAESERPIKYERAANITPLCNSHTLNTLKKIALTALMEKLVRQGSDRLNKVGGLIISNESVAKGIEANRFYSGLHEDIKEAIRERYKAALATHFHSAANNIVLDHRKLVDESHDDNIAGTAFDPSQRYLFAVSRRAILWDLLNLKEEPDGFELERDESLRPGNTAVGFLDHNDESFVYAALEGKIIFWNRKTGRIEKKVTITSDTTPSFGGAALSNDNMYLLGTSKHVRGASKKQALLFPVNGLFTKILNTKEKEQEYPINPSIIAEHKGMAGSLMGYSQDDSRFGCSVKVFAFSPYNSLVLTGGPTYTASVYDTAQHCVKSEILLTKEQGSVWTGIFFPDEKHVLIGSTEGFIYLWNIETGAHSILLKVQDAYIPGSIDALLIDPSGKTLLFSHNYRLYMYDLVDHMLVPLNARTDDYLQFLPNSSAFLTTEQGGMGQKSSCQMNLSTSKIDISLCELLSLIKTLF